MLIAKGSHVVLFLEAGSTVRPSGMLLHDESGQAFPAKRCLITSISKTSRPVRRSKWFGPDYQPKLGGINDKQVPGSRAELSKTANWKVVGLVRKIEYDRVGKHAATYKHSFRQPKPLLLQRGRVYCIVLRGGTKLNWRGFVEPGQ